MTELGLDGNALAELVVGFEVLAPLTDFLDVVLAVDDELLEAGGELMVFTAPGVGVVVHSHKPSLLTQA